jgi:hypothetical protein
MGALDPDPFGQHRTPVLKRWAKTVERQWPLVQLAIVLAVAVGLVVLALVTGELPEGG